MGEQEVKAPEVTSESEALEMWFQQKVSPLYKLVVQKTHDWEQLETRVGDFERQLAQLNGADKLGLRTTRQVWGTPLVYTRIGTLVRTRPHARSGPSVAQSPSVYIDALTETEELFANTESDFSDIQHRIVSCDRLERALAQLEDLLEGLNVQYLQWTVSVIKDALSYNFAEDMTEPQLDAIKSAIRVITSKAASCTKEDYQEIHKTLLQSGLCLLPNSQKAIDRYGERNTKTTV